VVYILPSAPTSSRSTVPPMYSTGPPGSPAGSGGIEAAVSKRNTYVFTAFGPFMSSLDSRSPPPFLSRP
jgi:hypothetical protein